MLGLKNMGSVSNSFTQMQNIIFHSCHYRSSITKRSVRVFSRLKRRMDQRNRQKSMDNKPQDDNNNAFLKRVAINVSACSSQPLKQRGVVYNYVVFLLLHLDSL